MKPGWFENDDVRDWLLGIPELAVDLVVAFAWRTGHPKRESPLVSGVEHYQEEDLMDTSMKLERAK